MAWLVLRPVERKKNIMGHGGGGEKRLKRKGAREGQDGTGVWQQKERRAIQLKGQWILRV